MIEKIDREIIPALLLSPKLRGYRYLLLAFISVIITFNFVLFLPSEKVLPAEKHLGWFLYTVAFFVPIYLNIKVLVPRILFKDKLLLYFSLLLIFVLLVIASIMAIQKYLFHIYSSIFEFGYSYAILNVVSAAITLLFLFAGTTALLLFKYWIYDMARADELESATLESELKLLKNQINPHFLFNMLNNANVLIKKKREEASTVLFKLEDLLRYQINDSSKDSVLLSSDIHFLNDFLNLEKIRRDKFEFSITKEGAIELVQIPPLLFISFVENAIKHNPDSENLSYVHLSFRIRNNKLDFCCKNSKPAIMMIKKDIGGLGLKNIRRRLELLYPGRHSLEIKDEETTYTVNLRLEL